jgi:hypothetical protein
MSEYSYAELLRRSATAALIAGLGSACLAGDRMTSPVTATATAVDECAEQPDNLTVSQFGNKIVVVRLDCVKDPEAQEEGAAIVSITDKQPGPFGVKRVKDRAVLEARCRVDYGNISEPGESDEWVQLSTDRVSLFDRMPLIDPRPNPMKKYVNSAYVVGEDALPYCDKEI